jgi:hypothetical protein
MAICDRLPLVDEEGQGRVMAIPPEDRKRLEDMGEERVRLEFNTRAFGKSSLQIFAAMWLAELDEAAKKRTEALQAEQTWLGKIAAYGAIGAIVVGIIGICVAIILWRFPRH